MKKYICIFILMIGLCACSNNDNSIETEENHVVYTSIKNHDEYIPVKQNTSINDFNISEFIEVYLSNSNINYDIYWVGEALSYRVKDYKNFDNRSLTAKYNPHPGDDLMYRPVNSKLVNEVNQDTLNSEGFRGISVYVVCHYPDEDISYRIDTHLLVYPDDLEDVVMLSKGLSIEQTQRNIVDFYMKKYPGFGETYFGYTEWERFNDDTYSSNID